MEAQNKAILKHLKTGRKITPIQALNLYGCFRLSARIHNLRLDGHKIDTIPVKKGGKTFASYQLNK